jgi:hypothetical protein
MPAWLGWAYFTRKVHPPWRGGVNFDLFLIFCACSISMQMQNVPGGSVVFQMGFRTKQKVLPPNMFLGPGLAVVTPPPYTYTKT